MRPRAERGELAAGTHELAIDVPGAGPIAATIFEGRRRGPRVFVIGGLAAEDGLGVAVRAQLGRLLDPARMRGTLIVVPRAPAAAARRLLRGVLEGAAFGVELRTGAPGWRTAPHLRADLGDSRARRVARAAGAEIVVDVRAPAGSFRSAAARRRIGVVTFEGAPGDATRMLLALLAAHRMIPGGATRPSTRAVVDTVTRVKGRRGVWVVPVAEPGQIVAAGDALGQIVGDGARPSRALAAPARAIVLAVPEAGRADGFVARVGKLRSLVRRKRRPAANGAPSTVGWSEWVALPDLGIPRLRAKVDTGARTSALHVVAMRQVGEEGGRPILELRLPIGRRPRGPRSSTTRVTVEGWLVVKDSGGHEERRPYLTTTLILGESRARVRVTLTDRGDMLFPMLVGRTALRGRVLVDPSRRDLARRPPRGG